MQLPIRTVSLSGDAGGGLRQGLGAVYRQSTNAVTPETQVVMNPLLAAAAAAAADGGPVNVFAFSGGAQAVTTAINHLPSGGWVLARINPALMATGRWTWVPALALFVIGITSDLSGLPQYYGGNYKAVLAMWFYDTGGDEGAASAFTQSIPPKFFEPFRRFSQPSYSGPLQAFAPGLSRYTGG